MTEGFVAFLASLAAGLLSALGLGGGGILVLYLTLVQGMDQAQAGGINLLFFLPAAAVAVVLHLRKGRIDWKMALRCLPFGVALPCWDPGWRDCWMECGFPKHLPSWCF